MSNRSPRIRVHGLLPILSAAALGLCACGEPLTLPPASLETAEITFTLYALTNTPVGTASAYNMIVQSTIRTDRTLDFDFAIDMVTATGGDTSVVVLPRGALGFQLDGGVQLASAPYDSVTVAPASGYVEDAPLAVDSGDVVIAASRRQQCNFGILRPRYAKLRVESVSRAQRSVTFRMRLDPNCGYRGLAPGVPKS